jgi:hypothetical protein
MRYFQILILILVVSGCASTKEEEVNSSKASAINGMQHVYFSGVIAKFYCENSSWPKSVNQLEEYSLKNPTPIGSKINWSYLSNKGATYNVSSDVYIRTPADKVSGSMSVSSIHQYPGCNGDSIKINFQPTLGG